MQAPAGGCPRCPKNDFLAVGVYLGYTVPWYREFYDFDHLLILGRVTSGSGGEIIMEKAKAVLRAEFPELAEQVHVFLPDEQARRVGQSARPPACRRCHREPGFESVSSMD